MTESKAYDREEVAKELDALRVAKRQKWSPIPLRRIVRDQKKWIDECRSDGANWQEISDLLCEAGITTRDGSAPKPGTLRKYYFELFGQNSQPGGASAQFTPNIKDHRNDTPNNQTSNSGDLRNTQQDTVLQKPNIKQDRPKRKPALGRTGSGLENLARK